MASSLNTKYLLVFYKFSAQFYNMDTGTKIRKIRELKNLKQEYIAKELGISQQQYSEIERNNVDIKESRLKEIAKILDVLPEDILAFDDKITFNIYENKNPTVNGTLIHNGIDKEHLQLLLNEKDKHYNELLKSKDKEIDFLKQLVASLQLSK
jgi:transcriptional regulator with XRE-family HTH domain